MFQKLKTKISKIERVKNKNQYTKNLFNETIGNASRDKSVFTCCFDMQDKNRLKR